MLLAVAVVLYTLGVALSGLDNLLGWLNTLWSALLSVFAALVVGLTLFRHQSRETDRKKREDLSVLLHAELGEFRHSISSLRTTVPDHLLDENLPLMSGNIKIAIHHPHPLVVEEAARSGLFDAKQTAAMLVLAREMRAHDLFLREATSLEPHLDRAWANCPTGRAPTGDGEFGRLLRRYAQAARMVQRSEESIVAGCEDILGSTGGGLGR